MKKRLMLAVTASLVVCAPVRGVAQEPSVSPEIPGADASIVESPDPLEALHGTWDYDFTDEETEFLATTFSPAEAAAVGIPGRSTTLRMGIDGEAWWMGYVFDGELWLVHGVPEGAGGTMTIDGDRLTQTNGSDGWATYEWSLDGDELTLTLVECVQLSGVGECPDVDMVRWMTQHTYTFSGSDPSY